MMLQLSQTPCKQECPKNFSVAVTKPDLENIFLNYGKRARRLNKGLSIIDNRRNWCNFALIYRGIATPTGNACVIARKSYVDCSFSLTAPLHVRRLVHLAADHGPSDDPAHSDGHLSQYQYSSGEHRVAVCRALCRPDGRPDRHHYGTHAEHNGQQH